MTQQSLTFCLMSERFCNSMKIISMFFLFYNLRYWDCYRFTIGYHRPMEITGNRFAGYYGHNHQSTNEFHKNEYSSSCENTRKIVSKRTICSTQKRCFFRFAFFFLFSSLQTYCKSRNVSVCVKKMHLWFTEKCQKFSEKNYYFNNNVQWCIKAIDILLASLFAS